MGTSAKFVRSFYGIQRDSRLPWSTKNSNEVITSRSSSIETVVSGMMSHNFLQMSEVPGRFDGTTSSNSCIRLTRAFRNSVSINLNKLSVRGSVNGT